MKEEEAQMSKALKDVVVLDLGQIYNGSYCSLLMAYHGAKVIKIEPLSGETLRKRTQTGEEAHEFLMLNSNKSGVSLNLKSEKGKELFFSLLEKADVLIENFANGVMEKLGLSYNSLKKFNSRLIYASGKGYGSEGPYADLPAMDLTIQAMSGLMSATGFPDSTPTKAGAAFADFMGGIHLYSGVMTALYQREKNGKGQLVDVSMHDTMYPAMASPIGAYYNNDGKLPERTGNRHSGLAQSPYNVYPSEDGFVAIFCVTDRHWNNLVKCIGKNELLKDPRFETNKKRVENMEVVDEIISAWTIEQKKQDIIQDLLKSHVPCAPILSVSEFADDPHLKARGMIREIDHPTGGRIRVPGTPIRLSESPLDEITPSPLLGEHTDQILKEFINIDDNELEKLRVDGVIS